MMLLAGLAWYQGQPDMVAIDEESLMGTAVIESVETEENTAELTAEKAPEVDCDPTKDLEDPNFKDCDKLSQK